MELLYLTEPKYQPVYDQIQRMRQKYSWKDMYTLDFLKKNNFSYSTWNDLMALTVPNWIKINEQEFKEIVQSMEESEKEQKRIDDRGKNANLTDGQELNQAYVSENTGSSWQIYKQKLLQKGFSQNSVNRIQNQNVQILRMLSNETEAGEPRKGLVVGNVQSGKTANMAALMTLAADNGWNYFVVLTGPTESLRKQTEDRLKDDFQSDSSNLIWDYIGYPQMSPRDNFDYLKFNVNRRVFFSVCLKNKKRLESLIRFLHKAPNPQNIKLMIIDDEADQASINTGNVDDEKKRKAINKLILKLVYGQPLKGNELKPFGAINYVSYTATPYANCLNEFKTEGEKRTLYPENFISVLATGDGYFGPDVIFGGLNGEEEPLGIVNIIPKSDVDEIKNIESGLSSALPETLKESIAWFICAASVLNFQKKLMPVSMLVHTSFKVAAQHDVYDAIRMWLTREGAALTDYCEKVYNVQKDKFTLQHLKKAYSDYQYLDDVPAYPEFKDIRSYVIELLSKIISIKLNDEDQEFTYNHGLILCEDNSSSGLDEEGNYHRLKYPSKTEIKKLGYCPAFLVVGGNTLSRGLTLEGLVSSYFLRNSIQADSLMQMGRWFGYRRGYELLPRIWMTQTSFEKFQFLVEIDQDLRDQIELLSTLGKKPVDFQLSLKTSPQANWLRLTAANKMQHGKTIELDYSGTDMQLTTYIRNQKVIRDNNRIITRFLDDLGKPDISEFNGKSGIWTDVPYSTINREIFEAGFKVAQSSSKFQDLKRLNEWIEKETDSGHLKNWTIILAGTGLSEDPERNFALDSGFKIGKVSRQCRSAKDDRIIFNAITNPNDFVAHLKEEDFLHNPESGLSWQDLKSDKRLSKNYGMFLRAADKDRTPLMIFYCIDRNNPSRRTGEPVSLKTMGIDEDLIAMAIVIPGVRGEHRQRIQIDPSFYEHDEDKSDED